ncbi:hypothetical protein [Blastococcus sp. SYSU DS1024]
MTETASGVSKSRGGRAVWTVLDQAVSSVGNAGMTILVATTVSPREFGYFAVCFSIYALSVAAAQALVGQTYVIAYAGESAVSQLRAARSASGAALVAGCIAGVLVAMCAAVFDSTLRFSLLALAVSLPGLLVQDCWRSVLTGTMRARLTFLNDALWTLLQVAAIVIILWAVDTSLAWPLLLAWGLSAYAAAIYGCVQVGIWPGPGAAMLWIRRHKSTGLPLVLNSVATAGSVQVAYLIVSSLGSARDAGSLRAAQTLLGPLTVLMVALNNFVLPELIRQRPTGRRLWVVVSALSALLALVDLAWGAGMLLIPDSWGVLLLGQSWEGAREVLPYLILMTVATGAAAGASTGMRAFRALRSLTGIHVGLGVALVTLATVGVSAGGAVGAALGMALASVAILPVLWLAFAFVVRKGWPDCVRS